MFLNETTPFLDIKWTRWKSRKIENFSKGARPWFRSKNGHLSSFFLALKASKMCFMIRSGSTANFSIECNISAVIFYQARVQLTFYTRLQRLMNFTFERVVCHPRKKEISVTYWKSNPIQYGVISKKLSTSISCTAVRFWTKTAT